MARLSAVNWSVIKTLIHPPQCSQDGLTFPLSAGDPHYHGNALEPLQFQPEYPGIQCVLNFLSVAVVKTKADVADRAFVFQALEFFG
jgi:hypothetical protein